MAGRINADKPHLWKADIAASVDQFNEWFMRFAPEAFRATRVKTTESVKVALISLRDLRSIDEATLRTNPSVLPTLRMCTAPPLAVDRLVGLAGANKSLIGRMEEGKLAARMQAQLLDENLTRVCRVLTKLLDRDIFPWLDSAQEPTDHERDRASTIVADRLCSAIANELVHTERRKCQLSFIAAALDSIGYRRIQCVPCDGFKTGEPGTYAIDIAVPLAMSQKKLIPIDLYIQPNRKSALRRPLMMDFGPADISRQGVGKVNRKVKKYHRLRMTYGESLQYVLMLGGHIDTGSLGVLASESLDWVWQHQIGNMSKLLA